MASAPRRASIVLRFFNYLKVTHAQPSPGQKSKPHLARDNQQWVFDWMVKETAMELYYSATLQYADVQHVVFETGDEKKFLHSGVIRCYDKVLDLAPCRIERVDVPQVLASSGTGLIDPRGTT